MKASKLILYHGVKIDENNVTNLTPANLLTELLTYKVDEFEDLNLVLENFTLRVPAEYYSIYDSNYMAFQNYGYSNKWFFAFIHKVDYISDSVCEIKFAIDYWSTFYSDLTFLKCFVEREITASDNIGENTLDEGLNVGRVECLQNDTVSELQNTTFYIGAFCEYDPDSNKIFHRNYVANSQIFAYGLILFKISNLSDYASFFEYIKQLNESQNASIEDMHDVFIVPSGLIDENDLSAHGFNDAEMNQYYYYTGGIEKTQKKLIEKEVTKLYSVSGKYEPLNNKCYCYPYNYMLVDNFAGNSETLKYEGFSSATCEFWIELALSIGISGRCVPSEYEDVGVNYTKQLPLAKLPTCSWSADSYTNWLTQNAVNIQSQFLSLGESIINTGMQYSGGMLLEAYGVIGEDTHPGIMDSGGTNVLHQAMNLIGQFKKAELLPDVQHGSNLGDVNFSSYTSGFIFKKMRCRDEDLKVIDDYFTKFGYKINRVKVPNLTTSRFNHFYVKIGNGEKVITGNVPKEGIREIENQLYNGLTVWKSIANIGNYESGTVAS